MIKRLFAASLMILMASAAVADISTFTSPGGPVSSAYLYPRLDLRDLEAIDMVVETPDDPHAPASAAVISRIEFKFLNANNLVARNLVVQRGDLDRYRAIVTSPWVFKKVLIEIQTPDFSDGSPLNYRVIVVDTSSSNNALAVADGETLIYGSTHLTETTRAKTVDVAALKVLDKRLSLKLLDRVKDNNIQIEATWMGHGSEVLTFYSPMAGFTPKALMVSADTQQPIEVILEDDFGTEDRVSSPALKQLLEDAFGPLPELR